METTIIVNNAVGASIARSVAETFWRVHDDHIKEQAADELPAIYEQIMLAAMEGKFSIDYSLLVLDSLQENKDRNLYLGTIVKELGDKGYKLAYSKNILVVRW